MFRKSTQAVLIQILAAVFTVESMALPMQMASGMTPTRTVASQSSVAGTNAAENQKQLVKLSQMATSDYYKAGKSGFHGLDPAMADIMAVPKKLILENIPRFEGSRQKDSDPYFMRAGKWRRAERNVSDFMLRPTASGVEIMIPDSPNKLAIEGLPLRPLWANAEYLIFTLDSSSNLFAEKAGDKNYQGESLFVIEVPRLKVMAANSEPVPVFTLPVSGNGWRENTKAMYFIEGDIFAIANGNDSKSFWMADVREVINSQKHLLDISVMATMLNPKIGELLKDPSYRILPAPGSTAGFGMVFTGLDDSRPGWNFYRELAEGKSSTASVEKSNSFSSHNAWVQVLMQKMIPQAHAALDPQIRDALFNVLYFAAIIASIGGISAFVLKYNKSVNARLDEIWKYRAEKDSAQARQEMRKAKDYFHVFGSFATSVAQFPLILPGLTSRFAVDRWLPFLGSAKHTLLNKVMHYTVMPGVRHFGDLSVTAKPTILGSGFAATAGVGLGYLMSFHALPAFAKYIGPFMGDTMNYALNNAFNSGNSAVVALLIINLLVSASIGVLRGAADFTMDAQSRVIEGIIARVDTSLREKGLNPADPKLHSKREGMINEEFEKTLVQLGLPTSKEKLFDSMALYQGINKMRGYGKPSLVDRTNNLNPLVFGEGKEAIPDAESLKGDSFTMNSRRGLLPWILKRAHQQAKEWHKAQPSEMTARALQLAEDAIKESARLEEMIKIAANHYFEAIEKSKLNENIDKGLFTNENRAKLVAEIDAVSERALRFRRLLTISLYEGGIEYTSKYLPKDWIEKYGIDGANLYVLNLRRGMASYLEKEGHEKLAPRREDVLAYMEKAETKATEELQKRKEFQGRSAEELKLNPEFQAEISIRKSLVIAEMGQAERATAEDMKFKPSTGWYERWVHRQVLKETEARMFQILQTRKFDSNEDMMKVMRDIYVAELSKRIGMHIQDLAPTTASQNRVKKELPWFGTNNAISRKEFQEIIANSPGVLSYDEVQSLAKRINEEKAAERALNSTERYQILLSEVQAATDSDLKQIIEASGMKAYMSKLSDTEKRGLYLQLYSKTYIEQYRTATTGAPLMHPVDPAQPGMTQLLRQALAAQTIRDIERLEYLATVRPDPWEQNFLKFRRVVTATGSSVVNRSLRFVDGFFSDTSTEVSLLGIMSRRVMLMEDVVTANIRNLYLLPVGLSLSWAWSHYALRTGIEYDYWSTGLLFQGLVYIPLTQALYKNYRLQGFQPFSSVKNFVLNNVADSILMVPGIVVGILMLDQVSRVLHEKIGGNVTQFMQATSAHEVATWLLAGALAWVGGKYYEEWKAKSAMKRIQMFKSANQDAAKEANREARSSSSGGISCEATFARGR